jgi:hypothetical protein
MRVLLWLAMSSVMTKSSTASGNATEAQDADFCIIVCPKLRVDYYVLYLLHTLPGADEVNGYVMAAHHCYS